MAHEATRLLDTRRMQLAQLVLKYRALPQDPLAIEAPSAWLAALLDPGRDVKEAPHAPARGPDAQSLKAIDLLSVN
jgi:hypothetical protein